MPLKQRKQIFQNKRHPGKNPNLQEADQLGIYKAWPRIWTRDYQETNLSCGRVTALNPGLPDNNTSALNGPKPLSLSHAASS